MTPDAPRPGLADALLLHAAASPATPPPPS